MCRCKARPLAWALSMSWACTSCRIWAMSTPRRFSSQLAGLDLGQVQHVVDDAQQVLAGPLDLLQVVALGVVDARCRERQVSQAQ